MEVLSLLTEEVWCDSDRERSQAPGTSSGWRQGSAVLLIGLIAVSLFASFAPRAIGQVSPETVIQFDIPAQPLDVALETYIRATGLQLLYNSALTTARFSTEVKGRFTTTQALFNLLVGTGLTARFTTEGAFTLFPVSIGQTGGSETHQISDYDAYLGNAQGRIISALCEDAATRPGNYRAALQFFIGRSGVVSDASLLDSTGDRTRDQIITNTLRGLAIGQAPPLGMPQPITMLVTPRAPQLPSECERISK